MTDKQTKVDYTDFKYVELSKWQQELQGRKYYKEYKPKA